MVVEHATIIVFSIIKQTVSDYDIQFLLFLVVIGSRYMIFLLYFHVFICSREREQQHIKVRS